MKTTLEIPDDLMRSIKLKAVREDRRLKDLIADLLRRGLAVDQREPHAAPPRVRLPLVHCARQATPDVEMTPERVADTLIDQEASGAVPR